MNASPIYNDDNNMTYDMMYGDNFHSINPLEDGVEWVSFTIISIDSLFFYENRYYLHVYLNNWAYKNSDKQMMGILGVSKVSDLH